MVKKEGGGERYDQLRKSKSFYEPSEQPWYISIYIKLEAVRYTEMSVCPISPGLFVH